MSQVDVDSFVGADERDGIFERREHAEAQQIDLDDAEIRAVLLVPLHHDPSRHRGRLKRNDLVEWLRGDYHSAAVLAEMAGYGLNSLHKVNEQFDPRCISVDAATTEAGDQRVMLILELIDVVELHKPVDLVGSETEDLADFTDGAARAVGDDVGGHRGAALAVATID